MTFLNKYIDEVSESEDDKMVYATDASGVLGKVKRVICPKNLDEVRKAVIYAKRNKIDLIPRGAGTGLVGGCVPNDSIVIDMSRMNKILEVDKIGKVVTVEPGVVLDDLNEALGELFFPIVPGSHRACTIGGMIATNAAGMRALKYGTTCDWIEELEVIDDTYRVKKIKEVKDFCGREGTTGIIVKAKLRVTTKPEKTSLDLFSFQSITPMLEKVKELKIREDVSAIEYLDKITSRISGLGEKFHLIVEYENDFGRINDGKEKEDVWKIREALSSQLISRKLDVAEDPWLPEGSLGQFLYWLSENKIPAFGHIGFGVIHPHFRRNDLNIEMMFNVVKRLNGKVSGEHGIGIMKREYISDEEKSRFTRLKQIYDKENIFNGGKIHG